MLSTLLSPQHYGPRRRRASGVIPIALLALGLGILLAGCGNDSDQSSPAFSSPRGIALDSANNRTLVVDSIPPTQAAVVAVNSSTGDRTILSDNATGVGPNFMFPRGIALDSANNRALVVDSSLAAVVAVDLSTGDRTILSDSVTGTGPNFLFPEGIALDSANNRILVLDSSLAAVIAVEPISGDRIIHAQ